ncbi:MAG TPA: RpiB/LacA/LacB family sugar-phosphate isomerase [Phycisphaerae bacterium]|nr:RpiB/LacA/LacB family sugar-phosphate isomerase [Phycisphaerae bacterium]
MRVGIAADHAGLILKNQIRDILRTEGHLIEDFGPFEYHPHDDYPDFVEPLGRSVAEGAVERGIAVCGSGVGAAIAANKVCGVRAAVVHNAHSARAGVEEEGMNVLCLGAKSLGVGAAVRIVEAFLNAELPAEIAAAALS